MHIRTQNNFWRMVHNPFQAVQLMGLLNVAKTGNKAVDTALALVLPSVASYALLRLQNNDSVAPLVRSFFRYIKAEHTQIMTYRSLQSYGTPRAVEKDSRNEYLIRAINLYINATCNVNALDDVDVDFSDVTKRKSESSFNNEPSSTKRLLKDCKIVKKPIKQLKKCPVEKF